MKTLDTPITRRRMLGGGAAFGLGSVLPTLLLSACGGGGSDDGSNGGQLGDAAPVLSGPSTRESGALNFDLSNAPIVEPRLQLYNSSTHGASLIAHTASTLAAQRAARPALATVADSRLTHYLPSVDRPAGALQIGTVVGKHPTTGAPVLAMTFIQVPSASVAKVAAKRAKTPLVDRQPARDPKSPAPVPAPLDSSTPPPIIDMHSAPRAIATALIFQHPAITNLNPDLGGEIVDMIGTLPSASSPYLGTLMYQIAVMLQKGYPTTSDIGSWAILVPRMDPTTGAPVLDEDGNQIYTYKINPALGPTVATIVKQILNNINNDVTFSGTNWQPSAGAPQQTAVAAAAAGTVGALSGQSVAASSIFSVNHSLKVGSRTSGIRFKSIECADDRSVSVTVANEFLRSASVFVEYRDASGNQLAVSNPGDLDTKRSKYLTLVSPDVQIMGVPLWGSWAPTTEINFTMPDAAAQAVLYYGGLGLGGADAFHGEALMGTICTLVVNIGLPSLCLTFGIYEDLKNGLSKGFQEAFKDKTILGLIMKGVVEALGGGLGSSIQTASTTLSMNAFIAGALDTVLDIFLVVCPFLISKIKTDTLSSAAQKAVPVAGEALWVLSSAVDLATIGETVIECVCCPAIDTNTISLSMAQSVSIAHDPNDYQLPATATGYKVVATYDGAKAPQVVTGTVTKGTVGPILVDLGMVASGGKVYAEVSLFNDQQCLVGYGKSETLANLPASAAVLPIILKEYLIPLDATTTYQHSTKLAYQGGAHAWDNAAAAPTATVTSLRPGADNALGALHGITVHTATGMAGYAFAAGGQDIPLCGNTPSASVSALRNVFLGDNPDSALKFSSCGASQPMGIAYDAHSAIVGGNSFFLQPGSDSFYHLRGVNLDPSDFDMAQTVSWGRFSNPLDSLCVLANGFVIGVNRDTHKMEVLKLPQQPNKPSDESDAVPFSALKSGWGSQIGLLDTPVAVCALQDHVLVLEQGNQRVQAFDQDGSAVNLFTDSAGVALNTPLMTLKDGTDASITYLDIAVEGLGYIYVMSCTNGGAAVDNYHLDVYTPAGAWLSRTSGVAAGAIAVDLFRNVYTLNYEAIAGAPKVEPSLSQWLPHSTTPCASTAGAAKARGAANAVPVSVCNAASANGARS